MSDGLVTTADVLGEEPPEWPITIGVALPIPEPFLAELGAYRERFGDPLAHAIVAHITLVPPVQVPDEAHLALVVRHLEEAAAARRPFPVVLAGAGTFRPISPVVFVPLVEGEEQVRATEAAVRRGPLDRPLQFPFHPHVTVAHDLEQDWLDQAFEVMQSYRAAFEVTSLGLFVQGGDGVWRLRVEFPFGGWDGSRVVGRRGLGGFGIEVLTPEQFEQACPRLGEILADSVRSGAGVTFVLPFDEADGQAYWRSLIPDVVAGRRLVLAARDLATGELVGTLTIVPAPMQNQPHRADLAKLLVASTHRRLGIATALMAAAEERARAGGRTLLTLDCVADGPEEDFYRGLGYHVVGRIPGYALSPSGQPEGAAFLYRDLA